MMTRKISISLDSEDSELLDSYDNNYSNLTMGKVYQINLLDRIK